MLLLFFNGSSGSIPAHLLRPDFNAGLQVREHYLSLLYHRIQGEIAWTLLDQGRVSIPEQTVEEKSFNRIDGVDRTFPISAPKTTVNLAIYLDDDIDELARILGTVRPTGGWTGNEIIQLDPTKIADLKVVNFDGATAGAVPLFTEYILSFRPTRLSPPLDADGDARMVEISGSAASYHIVPVAGL